MALLSAPPLLFGIRQQAGSAVAACISIAIAYAAFNSYYGCVYASMQDIVAPDQRGLTMSIYFMAMYLCGASFGPLITGSLSDHLARRAMHAAGSLSLEAYRGVGLQQAMVVMPALSVALALVLYLGSRTMKKDVERRQNGELSPEDLGLAYGLARKS